MTVLPWLSELRLSKSSIMKLIGVSELSHVLDYANTKPLPQYISVSELAICNIFSLGMFTSPNYLNHPGTEEFS